MSTYVFVTNLALSLELSIFYLNFRFIVPNSMHALLENSRIPDLSQNMILYFMQRLFLSGMFSRFLADYFACEGRGRGSRVIEVGAGCGLLSLAAACGGASVLATEQSSMVAHLEMTMAANRAALDQATGSVGTAVLNWGTEREAAEAAHRSPALRSYLGCSLDFLRLDGEGASFHRQPASMPIFQNFFANFLLKSQIFCKKQRILTSICDLPQFRQNSVKIAAKNDRFEPKFSKLLRNHEKKRENNSWCERLQI